MVSCFLLIPILNLFFSAGTVNFGQGCILDLKHAIRSVWVLDVNKSLCEKLIDSLPTRINLILKARGQPIKY